MANTAMYLHTMMPNDISLKITKTGYILSQNLGLKGMASTIYLKKITALHF